ncbi:autotransporter assembly complex protein TamB [Agarivorans sp. MS3-6]
MMFKTIKYLLLLVSALLFCLVLALSSSGATQWILAKASTLVDGLTISEADGNLYQGISAQQVIWQQAGLYVELNKLEFALDWLCISQTKLCVDKLLSSALIVKVDTAAMSAASTEPEQAESTESNDSPWTPPFPFVVNRLAVSSAKINVDGMLISWQAIQAQANWQKSTISVDYLHLDDWLFTMPPIEDSTSQPQKQASSAQSILPFVVELPDVSMPYQVIVDDLQLQKGAVDLTTQVLNFPSINLRGKLDFSYLELRKLEASTPWGYLQLAGTQGFQKLYPSQLKGRWEMQVEQQPLALSFQLSGDGEGLSAELSSEGLLASQVALNAAWMETNLPFDFSAELTQSFELLPEQLSIDSLTMDANGDLSGYQLQLYSDLAGLQDLWLNAQLSGDLSQLSQLAIQGELLKNKLISPQSETLEESEPPSNQYADTQEAVGGFNIKGSAQWQPSLKAELSIDLDNLQLSHWVDLGKENALPNLDGVIQAALDEKLWHLHKADLTGEWLGLPLTADITGQGNIDQQTNNAKVKLKLANTMLMAEAAVNEDQLALSARLQADNLAELPWLTEGTVAADIEISGPLAMPVFSWEINSENVVNQQLSLAKLMTKGQLTLDEGFSGDIDLALERLAVAGETINAASLAYTSNNNQQGLRLKAEQDQREAELSLKGEGNLSQWQGQLANAELTAELGTYYLSNPIDLQYANSVATIGSHCWSRDNSKICLLSPFSSDGESKVALKVERFDFAIFNTFMPTEYTVEGQASAVINAKLKNWLPQTGNLQLSLTPGSISQKTETNALTLNYQTVELNAQIKQENIHWQALFESEQLGALRSAGKASLDKSGVISGQLQLDKLQLSPLLPFINALDDLSGEIDGTVIVNGKLQAPQLRGEIKLTDGRVSGPDVPLSIDQLHTELNFDNQVASLNGGFNSEGKSAYWKGEFSWPDNQLLGELNINAKLLPISVDPYASLAVSPDVTVVFSDRLIDVSGIIAVEEGAIKVKSLPESAISESADAIVIEEQTETVSLQRTKIDLTVTLAEVITLEALGLDTKLKGELNLKQQPLEPLRANGRIELIDGEFNAYGQNLVIEKGWIMFTGPLEQPYLDFEAIRNPNTISDSVTVGVKVIGLADAPQVTLFSDPSMSQNEMLSYLLRGRALSDTEQDNNALSSMLLSAGINRAGGIVGNVGSSLGLSDLALSTAGSGSSTQVEVSAYVLPGVEVRYGMGVFDPVNELTVKYEILPKLFIEAFSGINSALDVYYEFYLD